MQALKLRNLITSALTLEQTVICEHLAQQEKAGGYKGIEAAFADSVVKSFPGAWKAEVAHLNVGAKNFTDRKGGRLDLVSIDARGAFKSAFEFKAVRLPRLKSGALYDVGQLAVDYLRLESAQKCPHAWLVAFLYGPLVTDSTSDGDLFRRFHNQMFLDVALASAAYTKSYLAVRAKAFHALGWNSPKPDASCPPNAFAVRVPGRDGSAAIGAVCYRARGK